MAMTGKAEMNVTPLIDVLLVLIIIFMVIAPIASRGLEAAIPQQASSVEPDRVTRDLVISVGADGAIEVNRQAVEIEHLGARLGAIYRTSGTRPVFVRGAKELEFREVARVMDIARGAGWERIGLMTQ